MHILRSVAAAFAMFSRIPAPKTRWDAGDLRHLMAAFPLVGVAVGIVAGAWGYASGLLGWNALLRGAGFALVPALVTGGIHLDGFCDTTDALASRAERARKLEILKDSHIGAFAAMGVALYLLCFAGVGAQLGADMRTMAAAGCVFVLSRALSGLAVVWFPCAKDSGLARTFADAAARRTCGGALIAWAALSAGGIIWLGGWAGAAAVVAALAIFGAYHRMAMREFGGITGDLAGWFLTLCEGLALLAMMAVQTVRL